LPNNLGAPILIESIPSGVWEISMRQTTQANKEGKEKKNSNQIKSNAE